MHAGPASFEGPTGPRPSSMTGTWRRGRSRSRSRAGSSGSSGSRKAASSRSVALASWPQHPCRRLP
eukprot:4598863-Alexandrium_andersonii.AAC.1